MKRNKTAVIGLGNILLADEGTGLHAVHLLEEKLKGFEVDVIEGGTPGYNLLHQFDEREKVIFIDAGNCGLQPGQFTRFTPEEVISRKAEPGFSLHEFDLIEFIEFAGTLDKTTNVEIVIYCMQAAEIDMSQELSETVKKSLPFLVEKVYNEVTRGKKDA